MYLRAVWATWVRKKQERKKEGCDVEATMQRMGLCGWIRALHPSSPIYNLVQCKKGVVCRAKINCIFTSSGGNPEPTQQLIMLGTAVRTVAFSLEKEGKLLTFEFEWEKGYWHASFCGIVAIWHACSCKHKSNANFHTSQSTRLVLLEAVSCVWADWWGTKVQACALTPIPIDEISAPWLKVQNFNFVIYRNLHFWPFRMHFRARGSIWNPNSEGPLIAHLIPYFNEIWWLSLMLVLSREACNCCF